MKVRLTRKLAERIDDVDLAGREVGDTFDLSSGDARCLLRRVGPSPIRVPTSIAKAAYVYAAFPTRSQKGGRAFPATVF